MNDLPTESPATPASPSDDILPPHGSAPRSRMRMLWFRAVTATLLVAAALTVLLAREGPTIFDAAHERLFPVVSPPSTQAAPTPSAPFDLKTAVPILQQRSLRVSALAAGATCVAAPGRQVSPDLGPALGDGPIYMVGYSKEGTNTVYQGREDEGWYYLKTLWTAPPDFHDVFLLRGRQVDGPNEVRFREDTTATPDLQAVLSSEPVLGSTPSGWLPWIDHVRVRAPGCYGIHVDGPNFSYIIRFKVVDTPYAPQG